MSVSRILAQKGRDVVSVSPAEQVHAIATVLSARKIGAVLVIDTGALVGIVSERDVVRSLAQHGAGALELAASDIMTARVHTCHEADSEVEIMGLMTAKRIRHLPVVEHGKVVGMISIGDVVKDRIESMEREAEDLRAYISSAG